jgi:hypothetical protein
VFVIHKEGPGDVEDPGDVNCIFRCKGLVLCPVRCNLCGLGSSWVLCCVRPAWHGNAGLAEQV